MLAIVVVLVATLGIFATGFGTPSPSPVVATDTTVSENGVTVSVQSVQQNTVEKLIVSTGGNPVESLDRGVSAGDSITIPHSKIFDGQTISVIGVNGDSRTVLSQTEYNRQGTYLSEWTFSGTDSEIAPDTYGNRDVDPHYADNSEAGVLKTHNWDPNTGTVESPKNTTTFTATACVLTDEIDGESYTDNELILSRHNGAPILAIQENHMVKFYPSDTYIGSTEGGYVPEGEVVSVTGTFGENQTTVYVDGEMVAQEPSEHPEMVFTDETRVVRQLNGSVYRVAMWNETLSDREVQRQSSSCTV